MYKFLLLLFIFFLSNLSGKVPEYHMIDLGLTGMDESAAIAINENDQVCGRAIENNNYYTFIWEKGKGLKFIEGILASHFNNRGMILGRGLNNKIILWTPQIGFIDLGMVNNDIVDFNDKGQVLIQGMDEKNESAALLWDNGKVTNLTMMFKRNIPGEWINIRAKCLNNLGHIVLEAYRDISKGGYYVAKSFLIKEGEVYSILPEKNIETHIEVSKIDDLGNMIIRIGFRNFWYENGSLVSMSHQSKILNGYPVEPDALNGVITKDREGNLYIKSGIRVVKLIKGESSFYNISHAAVLDRNSKGYFVGTCDTLNGYHAFIAIPE